MSDFFYGIQDLFENVLFAPLHFLRGMENWWAANTVNWMFMLIGVVALAYWLKQLKIFNDRNEENKDITAHSYL